MSNKTINYRKAKLEFDGHWLAGNCPEAWHAIAKLINEHVWPETSRLKEGRIESDEECVVAITIRRRLIQ
jgi:hypothetical protein